MKKLLYALSDAITMYVRFIRKGDRSIQSDLCAKVAMKLIWKLIDILPSQVLKFLDIFAEPGNIITYYTKSTRNVSRYTTRPPHYIDGISII